MNASRPGLGSATIVLAKAPVAGQAKTRLIPALGAQGAAELAARLLRHCLDQALGAGVGAVELCCAPDRHHPAFAASARLSALALTDQGGGDLGERMARAIARRLGTAGAVVLIGSDVPALDGAVLRQAHAALAGHDAVFVPTFDGGYALVGLRQPAPALFADMPWSTDQVMALTRQRLGALGLRHAELPTLADIDEPADLVHVPAEWW